MAITLTTTEYNDVRANLDIRLTDVELPNEVIALDSFLGSANDWIEDKIPIDTLELTDDEARIYRRIVRLRTSAALAGKIPQELRTSASGIATGYQQVDWVALVQKLERDSLVELEILKRKIGLRDPEPEDTGIFADDLTIFCVA